MVTNSPCARFITSIMPKITARPMATSARMLIRVSAFRTTTMDWLMRGALRRDEVPRRVGG